MTKPATGHVPWLDVQSLGIEVTRRCNLTCEHCLRGKPGSADMQESLLRQFLRNVSHIGEVTFSGGEPTLNLQTIRRFYAICDEYNIPVDCFFVATNGVDNQMELATILLEQYARIQEPEYRSYCGVALSRDIFHDGAIWRNTSLEGPSDIVKGLSFYTPSKEHTQMGGTDWIINRGNAYDNGVVENDRHTISTEFYVDELDGGELRIDQIYLSTNGYLYPDCDLSYEDMDAAIDHPDDCPTRFLRVTDALREQVRINLCA